MARKEFPQVHSFLRARIDFRNRSLIASIDRFSERRIRIKTGYPFFKGDTVYLECQVMPDRPLNAQGVVQRCYEVADCNLVSYMVDINWINLDERQKFLVREYMSQFANRRRQNRQEIPLTTSVIAPVVLDDLEVLNASANSLFVATEEDLPAKTHVRMILKTPKRSVIADGMVIHRVDPKRAKEIGRRPGVGLQILKMQADEQPFWNDFVENWCFEQENVKSSA